MVTSLHAYALLWILIGAERAFELWLSARNAKWTYAQGGVEVGAEHFPFMVSLHLLLPVACFAEVLIFARPLNPLVASLSLTMIGLSMGLRYWAIRALGPYWNTRVIVVPQATPIEKGPYRWVRHPNYVAVMVETLALPLAHGAGLTAVLFGGLQLLMLRVRIRTEEGALEKHCGYQRVLGEKPRFFPGNSPGDA
jgi:methyltransferase